MSFDPILSLYICISITIILIGWIIRLEIRINKLLIGKDARSLEDSIDNAKKEIEHLQKFEKDSLAYFAFIESRITRAVQSVETIRFNPFKGNGEGGNQSFSTAFINEKGDGVVLSSLYSRERVSIFSKPIKHFGSEFDLTEEEKSVITSVQSEIGRK